MRGPVRLAIGQHIALALLQRRKIPEQLIQTTGESEQHECVDKKELNYVNDHASQRYL